MSAPRSILHVDMDAFFASVEQQHDPALRGKPVLVGGSGQRGVVAAASYEAREFGVRSAMPMREALKRCPQAICVKPRMDQYQETSRQVFEIFRSITPMVEGLSLDEAFLDVTASHNLFGDAVSIAQRIRAKIKSTTGLTASVGVAGNKLVAKIASDLNKPDGLRVIAAGEEAQVLAPLSVRVLPGIGPRMQQRLSAENITQIAQLQTASDKQLERLFGRNAASIRLRALGIDQREVIAARGEKSISSETTFDEDIADPSLMERELRRLADRTASRLRSADLCAGVVQIKIREGDFTTHSRQMRLTPAHNSTQRIANAATALLNDWLSEHPHNPLRLLGVGASALVKDQQLDMFAEQPKSDDKRVDRTIDSVREKFDKLGLAALTTARTLKRSEDNEQ